eukprot:TRINITY_DN18386_c0_g1_i1.p1 TRINITY_DN18386_c0_g1~~TRINITY_DN18386_c0_g1_i1.p1  ORF type:complete len:236 (+),score=105.11 TRINITY_DN18386_c0_g1_i1:92-799(+)
MADSATIEKLEQLCHEKKFQECYDALVEALKTNPTDPELRWRFARAHFELVELKPNDKEFKSTYLNKGLEIITAVLAEYPENASAHKWYAILLSSVGDLLGTKEKLQNAFKIKEHAVKAATLKPDDSTAQHLLGRWCFSVANIGFIERKLASALFTAPPESSFQEALGYFLKCQELCDAQNVSNLRNLVFLGDTYIALKDKANAKPWYERAAGFTAITALEKELVVEAAKKLKSC